MWLTKIELIPLEATTFLFHFRNRRRSIILKASFQQHPVQSLSQSAADTRLQSNG